MTTRGTNAPIRAETSKESEHTDVMEVVAFGIPHPLWGEAVHAMLVVREGAGADAAALIAFTRGRLAAFKCPKSITIAESLPRNASGKVQRTLLRKRFREASLQS